MLYAADASAQPQPQPQPPRASGAVDAPLPRAALAARGREAVLLFGEAAGHAWACNLDRVSAYHAQMADTLIADVDLPHGIDVGVIDWQHVFNIGRQRGMFAAALHGCGGRAWAEAAQTAQRISEALALSNPRPIGAHGSTPRLVWQPPRAQ